VGKRMFKLNLNIFLIVFLLCPFGLAWSDTTGTEDLKAQQQKLKELLDRIEEAQDQRSQQRDMLRKLEKKMSCNMELIQDYDDCEKKYKDNLEEHVNCKHEAKKKAAECISSSDEK
jgi:septal ring factor EnvC (AmiA/AmiB activator)